MERQTVNVMITVDLDPLPGAMHTGEDAAKRVEQILKDRFPHYNPRVTYVPEEKRRVSFTFKRLLVGKSQASQEVPGLWWEGAIPVSVTAATEKEAEMAVMSISGNPPSADKVYLYRLMSFEQLGYLTS